MNDKNTGWEEVWFIAKAAGMGLVLLAVIVWLFISPYNGMFWHFVYDFQTLIGAVGIGLAIFLLERHERKRRELLKMIDQHQRYISKIYLESNKLIHIAQMLTTRNISLNTIGISQSSRRLNATLHSYSASKNDTASIDLLDIHEEVTRYFIDSDILDIPEEDKNTSRLFLILLLSYINRFLFEHFVLNESRILKREPMFTSFPKWSSFANEDAVIDAIKLSYIRPVIFKMRSDDEEINCDNLAQRINKVIRLSNKIKNPVY